MTLSRIEVRRGGGGRICYYRDESGKMTHLIRCPDHYYASDDLRFRVSHELYTILRPDEPSDWYHCYRESRRADGRWRIEEMVGRSTSREAMVAKALRLALAI